ncbi:PIN domain-like protein [Xylariomycetidae sp. FL2044]|nr:PIN domain-like protein [Xylariomycetidae sp. FL2044]
MGVNGLWTVIQPCARPTNLATLNRKRLAVDASIWIYQFLKAVRDKEGNALRNSHVVGFFRRICKLLWFGIRPVFVFDGGAPTLKRQTITGRKRRREGRREDAVRTAGKLLAVQMQRIAEEEADKRRRRMELENEGRPNVDEPPEEIPDDDKLVYVDELGMNQSERQKSRKFYKQDAYHLPELEGSIDGMGRPEDPRIMSIEELEEYARQFHSGQDINLYDFSNIDFEGEFFKSLPPADRYNILNAARLRSRLRMGLSKEQLDTRFPDRMAFSRFQIERVKERNYLTQRLMKEAGMTGLDLTINGGGRIAGEKDREYILVRNEGAEGGWALGVVSTDKDEGEMHKPIDVDALDFQYQTKEGDDELEDDDEFEDVPVEGVNRLPRLDPVRPRENAARRQYLRDAGLLDETSDSEMIDEDGESLFVQEVTPGDLDGLFDTRETRGEDEAARLQEDEDEDLNRAIAMSLKNQHGVSSPTQEQDDEVFEDVPAPEWTQKAAKHPKPVTSASGSMIAHIVNNRANAAVSRRRESDASSDDEVDLRAALSTTKKKADAPKTQPAVVHKNVKNPFDGPLPFARLDWKSSIFGKREAKAQPEHAKDNPEVESQLNQADEELSGGFVRDAEDEGPRPLPPWMTQNDADIRDSMKAQRERENVMNEEDRDAALEEQKQLRKEALIEIESSDSEDDIEIIENPPPPQATSRALEDVPEVPAMSPATLTRVSPPVPDTVYQAEDTRHTDTVDKPTASNKRTAEPTAVTSPRYTSKSPSAEADFEEVELTQPMGASGNSEPVSRPGSSEPAFEDVPRPESVADPEPGFPQTDAMTTNDELFGNDEFDDEFSDPEEEELLNQMAEEAEEHARFASQLNNKSEKENQEAYERELKALRTQQKKDRRDADEVTQVMITECQALLRYFGIPYITAPMEAEAQCAELVSLGLVDGIVTDDSDIFLFGGTRVYKNMFNSNKFVECYLGSDLERELSLSREQLISIAQLLGSDYTEGLPGVGPVTAVEILSEFPGRDGLARFREWWQDVQVHNRPKNVDQGNTFRRKFRKSQGTKLFLPPGFPSPAVFDAYLHPEVDSTPDQFQWGVPDVEGLRRFLMSTIGWSQERTDEVLVPVIRDMNRREAEGTQSNITRYFEGSVGVGAKEAFAPRQRGAQGSKRMTEAVNKLRAHAVVDSIASEAAAAHEDESLASEAAGSGTRKRKARTAVVVSDDDDEDYELDEAQGGNGVRGNGRLRGKGSKGKGKASARGKRTKASA